jgi:hypothetical protein
MSPTFRRALVLGGVALGASALTFLAVKARAAGIPEADGMTYTGYLEDADGAPLTGEHSIAVQFWASEEAEDDLCTGTLASVELQSGRFQVPLPISCSEEVSASPDIWVSVSVDGAPLTRTKLGSVPFALEAGHASSADEAAHSAVAADADGALDDRIGALENAAATSAFLASNTTATAIGNGQGPLIVFDTESFDVGNEHNPTTGVFTAKTAGYYDIGCNIMFANDPPSGPFYIEAAIYINDVRRDVDALRGDGYYQMLRARSMFKLAVGDKVSCRAYQSAGKTVSLAAVRAGEAVSTFSVFKLSR